MAKDAIVVEVNMNGTLKAGNGKSYKVVAFTYKGEDGKEKTENIFPGSNDELIDSLATLKAGDNVTLGFVKNPRNPKYWMLDSAKKAGGGSAAPATSGGTFNNVEKTEDIRRAVAFKGAIDLIREEKGSTEEKAVKVIKYAYMFMPFLSGEIERTTVAEDNGEGPY
jgi:hypothetical protein